MSEFEKWYKEKYPQALKQNTTDSDKYALEIWQAATAESDKRITELNAENKQIDAINASLQAHINVLREALERSSKSLEAIDFDWECEHGFHQDKCPNPVCEVKAYWDAIAIGKKALTSTPAQSLIQHDEVIERCASVCWDETDADNIRALKGK